jgi:glycosyl hydrolase family 113
MTRWPLALGLLLVLPGTARPEMPPGFHRGACVEGGPALQESNLRELAALGVTHVSLNPFGFLPAPDQPAVEMSTDRHGGPESRWWGESDAGLRQYAELAHRQGFTVMLRPHLWIGDTTDRNGRTGLWLGDVGFPTDSEWHTFFATYRELCLHYARLAEEARIEWYSVGAELTRTTLEHPSEWRDLIAEVRKVYRGKLLYSANWWREAEGIGFWGALDAIGVQAYYPVARSPDDTEEQMASAWSEPLGVLRTISRKVERPVLFTEVGYRPVAEGAIRPWEWDGGGAPRPEVQTRAYRALFHALGAAPEVQGVYVWKYHVAPPREFWSWFGYRRRTDYSWQGKAAEAVLRQAFRGGG